ncbi:Na+/H+ antiporter NhaA [Pollutimonas bauzanensis]|uniref:Na+/H+ antiporter NhaA n=1 Tax=Pollutimonas bauzanensis TaxID=658167 RepID=UPI000A025663
MRWTWGCKRLHCACSSRPSGCGANRPADGAWDQRSDTGSIFISMLAFSDENLLGAAKLGVLLGSLVAAVLGMAWGVIYVR